MGQNRLARFDCKLVCFIHDLYEIWRLLGATSVCHLCAKSNCVMTTGFSHKLVMRIAAMLVAVNFVLETATAQVTWYAPGPNLIAFDYTCGIDSCCIQRYGCSNYEL